jgi:hypothetical protein
VVMPVVLDVPILWRVVRHVELVELGLLAFGTIDKDAIHQLQRFWVQSIY